MHVFCLCGFFTLHFFCICSLFWLFAACFFNCSTMLLYLFWIFVCVFELASFLKLQQFFLSVLGHCITFALATVIFTTQNNCTQLRWQYQNNFQKTDLNWYQTFVRNTIKKSYGLNGTFLMYCYDYIITLFQMLTQHFSVSFCWSSKPDRGHNCDAMIVFSYSFKNHTYRNVCRYTHAQLSYGNQAMEQEQKQWYSFVRFMLFSFLFW